MEQHDRYISPFETRYASKEMQYIFSEDNKFRTWRRLWIALAKAEKANGLAITDDMDRADVAAAAGQDRGDLVDRVAARVEPDHLEAAVVAGGALQLGNQGGDIIEAGVDEQQLGGAGGGERHGIR